jgi:hypothetical protein
VPQISDRASRAADAYRDARPRVENYAQVLPARIELTDCARTDPDTCSENGGNGLLRTCLQK